MTDAAVVADGDSGSAVDEFEVAAVNGRLFRRLLTDVQLLLLVDVDAASEMPEMPARLWVSEWRRRSQLRRNTLPHERQ